MKHYRVSWEIDIYANSPEEAALAAQEIQRRETTTATVFDVYSENGDMKRVDLLEGKAA